MNAENNTSVSHKYYTTQTLTNPLWKCKAPQTERQRMLISE